MNTAPPPYDMRMNRKYVGSSMEDEDLIDSYGNRMCIGQSHALASRCVKKYVHTILISLQVYSAYIAYIYSI